MKKTNVGIIGCGFIGGSLKTWLEEHNDECNILVSDPPKGYNDDMATADIIFISIHIPTEKDNIQDLSLLKDIIKKLPDKPIFIRTTITPGTTDLLRNETGKDINFMPEFLTQRTAYQDFCTQPMIFTGHVDLLKRIFKTKKFIVTTSLEAEISKYAHNVFGALKVTYFNGIYELCQKQKINYENVRQGLLLSEYINDTHTNVPGPDGKLGYGGKCFPKDVDAFTFFCQNDPIFNLLKELKPLNTIFRNDSE